MAHMNRSRPGDAPDAVGEDRLERGWDRYDKHRTARMRPNMFLCLRHPVESSL